MKSKSFDLGHASGDNKLKQNKSFDFINLYKSASDATTSCSEKNTQNNGTENSDRQPHIRKIKEKREPVELTPLNIEGPHQNEGAGGSTPRDHFKVTSTPIGIHKPQKSPKVKSIMKVSSSPGYMDDTMDGSQLDASFKPKKRNKSVSFLLEDNDEIKVKKTKSNDSTIFVKSYPPNYKGKKHLKKDRKDQTEKENKVNVNDQTADGDDRVSKKSKIKMEKQKAKSPEIAPESTVSTNLTEEVDSTESKIKRKHLKKAKKQEKTEATSVETTSETAQTTIEKVKKSKKKKYQEKNVDTESEEPVSKSRKKDENPDVISDLENLSIGENAHTLTNLLDEMTVVDKDKRKKLKQNLKNKTQKSKELKNNESEKEDVLEKKKWKKKWNKGDGKEDTTENTIIVENLAFSLLFNYKKLLAEHFVKYGLIKNVGIAEVYPTEEVNPVFTTTINFYSDGAATQALQEDKTMFEGRIIRVKRTLPPTDTTLVVRSYGPLTPQYISSEFCTAGKIRNIRQLVKGKHSMATFFVEFDGRESKERALKLTTDLKIGGKKIHVSRFEPRIKKPKTSDLEDNVDELQS